MNIREFLVRGSLRMFVQAMMSNEQFRCLVLNQVERRLYKEAEETGNGHFPYQAQLDRLDCASALLHGMNRIVRRGLVSKRVMGLMLQAFLGNVILNEDSAKARRKLGFDPPSFITISPTGKCNLKCTGCYASDAALKAGKLDFDTFDRIVSEKVEMWGSHFTVISGGEPLLWEDKGYDLVKLAERHRDDVFMVYTNGTLIDDRMAGRMADAGNITPAISVEGFEGETDARRGEGVYRRILDAFGHLRRHGIPFGVSATSNCDNWEIITSEEFADFYFMEQGALYSWLFQYMPIGRGQSLDKVVPPEARLRMIERMWHLVRTRKVFMVDFWNSGTASMGCIAAGRGSGYFHINWDGDIMPCVFTPYAAGNIHEVYGSDKDLNAVINLPFFRRMRQWQADYGYQKPRHEVGNWICPCAIRDHYEEFAEVVRECEARPINDEAGAAMQDPEYHTGMAAYGKRMKQLTDRIWIEKYLKPAQDATEPGSKSGGIAAG